MKKVLFLPILALTLLCGCSETTTTQTAAKKEAEKALEPVTGLSALFKMFQVARSWGGSDLQILKMNSMQIAEAPDVPRGKAGAWQCTFVSPSKNTARTYTYSIAESAGNLHQGVRAGSEEGWSGAKGTTSAFRIEAVKSDTDAAYKTALEQGAEYDKKNPGKPIIFLLEKATKDPDPHWRVVWGESVGTSNFSVLVYLEKLH